jgi:hypothetical protein
MTFLFGHRLIYQELLTIFGIFSSPPSPLHLLFTPSPHFSLYPLHWSNKNVLPPANAIEKPTSTPPPPPKKSVVDVTMERLEQKQKQVQYIFFNERIYRKQLKIVTMGLSNVMRKSRNTQKKPEIFFLAWFVLSFHVNYTHNAMSHCIQANFGPEIPFSHFMWDICLKQIIHLSLCTLKNISIEKSDLCAIIKAQWVLVTLRQRWSPQYRKISWKK